MVTNNSGDLLFDQATSFTVGFWVNYTDRFNDNPIIGTAVNSTYQEGWVFTDEGGDLEWSLASYPSQGAFLRDPVSTTVIGDGAWHNVVGVVDRSQQMALVYIDGVLQNSWSIVSLGSLEFGNAITIGQDPTGNYGTETFSMDDLGIWRRALTSYEVASIYEGSRKVRPELRRPRGGHLEPQSLRREPQLIWQTGTLLQSTNAAGPYTAGPDAVAPYLPDFGHGRGQVLPREAVVLAGRDAGMPASPRLHGWQGPAGADLPLHLLTRLSLLEV